MSHRDPQPSQPTGIHENGNGSAYSNDDDDPPPPVWREFIKATILTSNQVQALVEDSARRAEEAAARHAVVLQEFTRVHRRLDVVEGGVLECVVENRARKNEIDRVRLESREGRDALREELARAARTSAVDEKEREVIVDLAKTGAQAAKAHMDLRGAEKSDALDARKERRSLLVAGIRRAAPIAIPILTAAAGVLAGLIAKGC